MRTGGSAPLVTCKAHVSIRLRLFVRIDTHATLNGCIPPAECWRNRAPRKRKRIPWSVGGETSNIPGCARA